MELSGRRWDRLVPLLFLGVVVLAAALLIAGYGVAVGVGALVGLLLGLVAGVVGALWLGRGPGRSITFGREWSSVSEPPMPGLMVEMRELAEISGVDTGRTTVVVPVLTTAEVEGLVVDLVTVELREAGMVMTMDVTSRPGVLPAPSTARVSVSDDAGTIYRAAAQAQGGMPGRMRYTVTAIPAPPRAVTHLVITIERFFDPFPGGRQQASGPWVFSVSLPPR